MAGSRSGVTVYPTGSDQLFCDDCGKAVDKVEGKCVSCGKVLCRQCAKRSSKDGRIYCEQHLPSEGCFIATAAYGTPMAREINVLRQFRDTRLRGSLVGRRFIQAYYSASPPLAAIIAQNEGLKKCVRYSLEPVVRCLTQRD